MRVIFKELCPNCGKEISDVRLSLRAPCEKCLPVDVGKLETLSKEKSPIEFKKEIFNLLKSTGTLQDYENIIKLDLKLEEIDQAFQKITGNPLWSAQRTWAKRALSGRNFAIVAPTGVGKTIFGILMAIYFISKNKKCYLVLPTTVLVQHVFQRIIESCERLNVAVDIAAFHSRMKKKEKELFTQKLQQNDFSILITSSQFLARKFESLKDKHFDFIFVDDVDSLLRRSKNINRVLNLLGFDDGTISKASEVSFLKRRYYSTSNSLRFIRGVAKKEEALKKVGNLQRELHQMGLQISQIELHLGQKNSNGQLIISTATGKVRGKAAHLFKELLGFDVGSTRERLRNVQDLYYYPSKNLNEEIYDLIKLFGDGALIFIPKENGAEIANKLADFLKEKGIKAEAAHAGKTKIPINEFANKEVDVLIGIADYYGTLVRGIDLPQRIRYTIFTGIPKFKFSLEVRESHPYQLIVMLAQLKEYFDLQRQKTSEKLFRQLQRFLYRTNPAQIETIRRAIEENLPLTGYLERFQKLCLEIANFLKEALADPIVKEKITQSQFIAYKAVNGKEFLLLPDVRTYIQASGRTSRMFAGGITKGASIVIIDESKLFKGLARQLKWYFEESEWKALNEIDVKELINRIDTDRQLIKSLLEGKIDIKSKDLVKSALLVVESPNKARTIAYFFGKPTQHLVNGLPLYEVNLGNYVLNIIATGGHILDLVTLDGFHGVKCNDGNFTPIYSTIKRCLNCGQQFIDNIGCPFCHSTSNIRDSITIMKALQELTREVDETLIATDIDTEGEKIGWDVASAAAFSNKISRIEFHEITKPALMKALQAQREIEIKRVESQIVRRIEDRWIGFELSRRLWEAFPDNRGLSAGRVQTPVLGWIIQRYDDYCNKKREFFELALSNNMRITLENKVEKPKEYAKKLKTLKAVVKSVEKIAVDISPLPPYATDSLLLDATRKMKLGSNKIMALAQELFELGLITYHRTDSTRVSLTGQKIAQEYITEHLKPELLYKRLWGEEGAHECIRPTRPIDANQLRNLIRDGIITVARTLMPNHYFLYHLVFSRFVASQMKSAKVLKQKAVLEIDGVAKEIEGTIKVLDPGFMSVYQYYLAETKELNVGEEFQILDAKFRKRPAVTLYSQADIIDLMKKRHIGRPSTYAKIISTLIERGYVIENKVRKLIPTQLGQKVYEHLYKNYGNLVSEERTRELEEKMESIEAGQVDYQYALQELYSEVKALS